MSIIKGTNQIVAGFGGTKRSIGEVYFSQSALATDNSGALPLFTGETIASANTIYPEFYNWVSAHTELQCTSAEYESALTTYGECPKYVVINSTPTRYKWENPTTGVLYTLSRNPAVGDLAYDVTGNSSWPITEASSTEIVVPTFADNKPLSYVEEVAGTSASIRLPKLSNYIKAANHSEGIKNIEAGLPNITGDWNSAQYVNAWSSNGAIYGIQNDSAEYNSSSKGMRAYFDASRSSAVYGKSSTVTPASTTLYPWVVAYAAAIPASTAQATEFQQGLSGKADTNLGNIPSNYDYVVESYRDANGNWYRLYKNGWLEQGGVITNISIGTPDLTMTLLKPFADANYCVILTGAHADYSNNNIGVQYGNVYYGCLLNGGRTTTSFKYRSGNGAGWYTCGQSAS